MKCVFRISEAGAIAIHAAVYLASMPDRQARAPETAAALGISEAHLMKVLQQLSRAGICHATRGPKGGFRLVGDPGQITLLRIFEAIEGPISGRNCLFNEHKCRNARCLLGDMVERITDTARKHLAGTTLAEASAAMRAWRTVKRNNKGG